MAGMKMMATMMNELAISSSTAVSLPGASSQIDASWHAIEWRKVHQNVRRLQARIVKATQEKRWGKVKALQRLLTRSFSGKALAVKRVTENKGKRTAGVDGEKWNSPIDKQRAIERLRQHGYRAQPLRRIYIPKPNGKGRRPLSIPTMRDRAMQALYLLALDPIAETTGDPNSYGFRKNRSPADAIAQSYNALRRKGSATWILEADIRSYFDTISHEWLEANIPLEKPILRQWLKAGYIENGRPQPTEAGVPQGGIISPVIANLVLDGLEAELRRRFPISYRAGNRTTVRMVRFADDFIITGNSEQQLRDEVQPVVEAFLQERGVSLSQEKTRITHIETGFDFLGQNIRKYNGKLLIKPSTKSVKRLLDKVRATIKANNATRAGHLIVQLNPVIRGWAYYHRHVVSKQTFKRVDTEIFKALWQWAKRRHPRKRWTWIRQKYFSGSPYRQWHFNALLSEEKAEPQRVWLLHAARIPIERHTKIRADANPYDPTWEPYFEQRIDRKTLRDLRGRWELRRLWRSQHGICPVCRQKITKESGWHSHHIVWRVHGGSDGNENRVLLHPNCHQQVHVLGLKVEKPRLATGV